MRIAILAPVKLLLPAIPLVAVAIVGLKPVDPAPAPIAEVVRVAPQPKLQPQPQPKPQPPPKPAPDRSTCCAIVT